MHRLRTTLAIAISLGLTAACGRPADIAAPAAAKPISDADAGKIADRTEAAWASMDARKIKALYTPDVIGFDMAVAPLSTDRATWDGRQDAFAAAKLDKLDQQSRRIQILTPDIFIVSGMGDMTSSSLPANDTRLRFTDVFQKQLDGSWLIVNEHVSVAPKG